jgi:diguanylate cyclase (GGDEF)-like protein/PAS domain S-box-containing protein
MDSKFLLKFGQDLCDLLSSELGLVCSFMGEEGRIIASSAHERIGNIHAGAARIMAGEMDEYGVTRVEADASAGMMREGFNMAIDLDGRRLVSFGIAGPLELVRPLAKIVRFSVISLLRVRLAETIAKQPYTENASGALAVSPVAAMNSPKLWDLLDHANESIESSLARLRDVVDNIDHGISVFDARMRLLVWNKRFLEVLGFPEDIVSLGLPLEAFFRYNAQRGDYGPGNVETLVAERMSLAYQRQSHRFERVRPNGTVLEVIGRPLNNGGFVTTYADITYRKTAEDQLRRSEERFSRIFSSCPVTIVIARMSDGLILDVNNTFVAGFGWQRTEVKGTSAIDIGLWTSAEKRLEWAKYMRKNGGCRNYETTLFNKTGQVRHVLLTAEVVNFEGDDCCILQIDDLTDLKFAEATNIAIREKNQQLSQSEKILRESEKHIRALFNGGNDPIFVYEIDSISGAPQGPFTEVNDIACSRLRCSRKDLLLRRPADIIAPEAAAQRAPHFKLAYDRQAVYESTYITNDGQSFPVEINAHVFDLHEKTLVLAVARDITERKKAEADLNLAHAQIELRNAELEELSVTDQLTGLYNRRKLDQVFTEEMKRVERYGETLSVVMADIDKFKSVNDLHGHQVGDKILSALAELFRCGVRETDVLGRWGGEEFMVICPCTDLEGAQVLAEKLRQMVEANEFAVVRRQTCSFGVAQLVMEESIEAMVARADAALYRAKEGGRNRVESDDQTDAAALAESL